MHIIITHLQNINTHQIPHSNYLLTQSHFIKMQAFTVVNASIAIATVALAGTIQARDVTIDLWNDWNFEGTHWSLQVRNNNCCK